MKRLILIPAHNEEDSIHEVVSRALRFADVSVTDDGSRDKTPEILLRLIEECEKGKHPHRLHTITHPTATHIPRALQDGFRYGVEQNYDQFLTMDAGLSHDPDHIPRFFEQEPAIDLVIGSRATRENAPLYRQLLSWLAARTMNYILSPSPWKPLGPNLQDCTSGFRRYSRRAAKLVASTTLRSKSFDFHIEILALCLRAGHSAREIPIHYVFSNSSFNRRVLLDALRMARILHRDGRS